NLIQEMTNSDREFQRRLRRVIESWIRGVEAHIRRGQKSGHVLKSVDARMVSEHVVMLHEGAFAIIKGLRNKGVFHSLLKSLEMYFAGIAPGETKEDRRSFRK